MPLSQASQSTRAATGSDRDSPSGSPVAGNFGDGIHCQGYGGGILHRGILRERTAVFIRDGDRVAARW